MRRAGKRSFDGNCILSSVDKPSTDALRAGFGMPYAANDRSDLGADVTHRHRFAPGQSSKNSERTSRQQDRKTAVAAKPSSGSYAAKGCLISFNPGAGVQLDGILFPQSQDSCLLARLRGTLDRLKSDAREIPLRAPRSQGRADGWKTCSK